MNTYDEDYLQDLLSDARWDAYLDAMEAERATYQEVCAINGWSPEDYPFEQYLEDI
ncbi:MAG: hypothetical protein IK073_04885 [Paludibacteraceae bacterium]|nr:hypothetical protein [Paludibacteraceae bacterium]